MIHPKRILIAPLDWGLGHATRCIPIIQELIKRECEVIIASDGRALALLQKEFPELPTYPLPSYRVRYQSHNMIWNMAWQLPRIQRAIWLEHRAIQRIIKKEKIDIILSDNRFGCWSPQTKNVFITHQLNIQIPIPFLEKIVNWTNHRLIRRFDECWIPDFSKEPTLAGVLSLKGTIENVTYIGPLSRMCRYSVTVSDRIVIVLSGPEPQRTYLEKIIIEQLRDSKSPVLIVRGLTDLTEQKPSEGAIQFINFMTSKELNDSMLRSKIIICRAGYSSLMDLAILQKPAILIPTPGQTEQEYLAKRFEENGIFLVEEQESMDLNRALEQADTCHGFDNSIFTNYLLQNALDGMLNEI